jgi:hypothetical protein
MIKNTKEYNGMYLGIVVQNNDPDRSGKIKVFVPHVTPSVYENWYSKKGDKKFNFIGVNLESDLTEILEPLKEVLPWAQCAMPLAGGSGAGRYNAYTQIGSVSDTNKSTLFKPITGNEPDKNSLNVDDIGESPGRKYEFKKYRLRDAFDSYANNTNRLNKYAYEYIPSTYSNKAKGSFGIPNVGTHVWVFFQNGSPLNPVYFAVSSGQEDWKGIYGVDDTDKGIDYPGNFENLSAPDTDTRDINTDTYRNKFVLNQKGGSLEFINTDNKETLKMTHYSGSFKEFNNYTNIELATGNDQKLVLEDSFSTVNGHSSLYVGRDCDNLIKGDFYRKIGSQNREYFNEWKRIIRPLADIKQLFEIQRAGTVHNKYIKRTSANQSKSGTHAPCPVCNAKYKSARYKGDTMSGVPIIDSSTNNVTDYVKVQSSGGDIEEKEYSGQTVLDKSCPVCGGTGRSPSSMDGEWQKEAQKDRINELLPEVVRQLAEVESKMGLGGSEIIDIAKDKVETIGLAMNDLGSIRLDDKGKLYNNGMSIHPGGTFVTKKESPLLEYVHVDDLPGGSYTLNVCNKFNCQVGAGGIKMRSYGPVEISGSITNVAGEQVNIASENEVNIDGGKRLTIVADILQIRQRKGEQVLVDSNLGVNGNVIIGGGMHVEGELSCHHITAPVEIQETELTRVFAKLLSGLKFDAKISSDLKGSVTGHSRAVSVGGNCTITLVANSNDDKVLCYDHSHHFKNVPLHLKQANDDVRDIGKKNTETDSVIANIPEKVPAKNKVK